MYLRVMYIDNMWSQSAEGKALHYIVIIQISVAMHTMCNLTMGILGLFHMLILISSVIGVLKFECKSMMFYYYYLFSSQ